MAAGVPEGPDCTGLTVTEPLCSGAACAAPMAGKPAMNAAHERLHPAGPKDAEREVRALSQAARGVTSASNGGDKE